MADRVAVINQGKVVQVAPPTRLYRHPRNRFVAEFLGETNLMPGRIVERAGPVVNTDRNGDGPAAAAAPQRVIVETPVGRLVSASISRDVDVEKALDARSAEDAAADVLVSIRPEAVRVNASEGVNTVFAKVRESTYLGETAQLVALVAKGHDAGESSADAPAHAGSSASEGVEWKIAVLNPLGHGLNATMTTNPAAGSPGGAAKHLTLSVSPGDVVVLPMPPHLRGAVAAGGTQRGQSVPAGT